MIELIWDNKDKMLEEVNSDDFLKTDKHFEYNREESKNFDTTENLYIEGDNLEALKLLQKDYKNKIKMIYIDPPYNTEKKFIYNDTFRNKRKKECRHSGWLNMMYPRLKLARYLLKDDGIIFISIDDYEQSNIKKICDEIFGEHNFINNRALIWHITDGTNKGFIARAHEYILAYAKNINVLKPFIRPADKGDESIKHLTNAPGLKNKVSQLKFPKGLPYEGSDSIIDGIVGGEKEPIKVIGKMIFKDGCLAEDVILESSWRNKKQIETFFRGEPALDERGQQIVEVFFKRNGKPMYRKKLSYFSPKSVQNFKVTSFEKSLKDKLFFNNPKPVEMLRFLTGLFEDKDFVVLDFFSGSSSTAHAVMQLNAEDGGKRKFIMVQLPEETDEKSEAFKAGYKNICEIGKERIRRAGDKIVEDNKNKEGIENLDIGFKVIKIK